jgi:hypothetical protein
MDQRREIGSARLLFRFAVGGAGLAAEWFGTALRAVEQQPVPAGAPPEVVTVNARSVVVGALSAALRWRPPAAPLAAASRTTTLARRRGLRLLARVPGAGLVERRARALRERAAVQLRRWAREGAREQLEGRRLARLATPAFVELAVARLADSPELRTVIEEQSEGLAAQSVAELRERSQEADGAVERFVRRVFRRQQDGAARAPAQRATVPSSRR